MSGWLYYVCLYGICVFFSSCFPIFIEGIFYGTIVYSWGLDAPPFCVYKKYISIKGNIGRNIFDCTVLYKNWVCRLNLLHDFSLLVVCTIVGSKMPPKRGDYKTNGDVLKKHSLKYSTKKTHPVSSNWFMRLKKKKEKTWVFSYCSELCSRHNNWLKAQKHYWFTIALEYYYSALSIYWCLCVVWSHYSLKKHAAASFLNWGFTFPHSVGKYFPMKYIV